MSTAKKRPKSDRVSQQLNSLLQIEKARNDVVVQEIPVFLSKTLMEQLCLIQYPQKPAHVSTKNVKVKSTKIKPLQKRIQMTVEMNRDSEMYDPESAELLAEAAAGLGLDEDKYMPDHRLKLDKITMESTNIPKLTDLSRYAVGVIKRDQIVLTPISSVVQMKTVFPYLNKAEKARAAFQKEQAGGDTEDEAEEPEATKVTVKFSRTAPAAEALAPKPTSVRMSSFAARKLEEEEAWVDLEYFSDDPEEFEKLSTPKSDASTPFYVLSKAEYLQRLFPKHAEATFDSKESKARQNTKISVQQMRELGVADQVKILLTNAKLLQFHQIVDFLKTRLKSDIDEASLLRTIQTVGVLVQGCWVVRSDILYPEEFKSGINGITGSIMQRGRDLILSQFTESRFVERKKMIALTRLPSEEVKEILSQVSKMVAKKGWEFLLPFDTSFVTRFSEIVERQTLYWQMRKNSHRTHRSSSSESTETSSPPPRRRSRNKSISSGDESDGSRRRRQSESGGASGRRQRRSSTRSEAGIPTRAET